MAGSYCVNGAGSLEMQFRDGLLCTAEESEKQECLDSWLAEKSESDVEE